MQSTLNLSLQPPERLLHELLRILPDAGTMGDDQFVEFPREQPFEGSLGELPVRKRKPYIERNTATRSSNAPEPRQGIAEELPFTIGWTWMRSSRMTVRDALWKKMTSSMSRLPVKKGKKGWINIR
jgi:hypothetical protein